MNAPVKPLKALQPHLFTVDEVLAIVRAGVIDEGAKVELIDGELVDMAAEGSEHTDWVYALGRWLFSGLGPDFVVVPSSTLVLSDQNGPKPDWWIFSASLQTAEVRGPDVLLAIEVANTSIDFDLGAKAALYARYGVRDYWVAQVQTRQLVVHRDPATDGYGYRQRFNADEAVAPLLLPGLSLRLDALKRVG